MIEPCDKISQYYSLSPPLRTQLFLSLRERKERMYVTRLRAAHLGPSVFRREGIDGMTKWRSAGGGEGGGQGEIFEKCTVPRAPRRWLATYSSGPESEHTVYFTS